MRNACFTRRGNCSAFVLSRRRPRRRTMKLQVAHISVGEGAKSLIAALRVRERRLHVAPKEAKLSEFPEAELLRMNAEAAALLKFVRDEKTEACLKSVMVSCAKEMRDRRRLAGK